MVDDREAQVVAAMQRLNDAVWNQRWQDLEDVLHPDVVFVAPGFEQELHGRKDAVDSYRGYFAEAGTRGHSESQYQAQVIGSTAVVSYVFEVTYERDGEAFCATGRDLFVFTDEGNGWKAVWRTMMDFAEEPA